MFYSNIILAKKGPLGKIWLAAHWEKKVSKAQVFQTDIDQSVCTILDKSGTPLSLRVSGHLLLGVVRIYERKVKYLVTDCTEALVKVKMAFRPGVVDMSSDDRRLSGHHINISAVGEYDIDDGIGAFEDVDAMEDDWMQITDNNISHQADITLESTPRKSLRSSSARSVTMDDDEDSWTEFNPDEEPIDTPRSLKRGSSVSSMGSVEMEVAREADRRQSVLSALSQQDGDAEGTKVLQEKLKSTMHGLPDEEEDDDFVQPMFDDSDDEVPPPVQAEDEESMAEIGRNAPDSARKISFGDDMKVDMPDDLDDVTATKKMRMSSDEGISDGFGGDFGGGTDTDISRASSKPPPPVTRRPRKRKHTGPKLDKEIIINKETYREIQTDTSSITIQRLSFANKIRTMQFATKRKPEDPVLILETIGTANDTFEQKLKCTLRDGLANEYKEIFDDHTSKSKLPYVSSNVVEPESSSDVFTADDGPTQFEQESNGSLAQESDIELGRQGARRDSVEEAAGIDRIKNTPEDDIAAPMPEDDDFVAPVLEEDESEEEGIPLPLGDDEDEYIHNLQQESNMSAIGGGLPEESDSSGMFGTPSKNSTTSSVVGDDSQEAEIQETEEQRKWHQRTLSMMKLLQKQIPNENDKVLYQDLAKNRKRRTVAGCFFEILQLKTWGRIDIKQDSPYGTIEISKAEKFDNPLPA